MICEMLIYGRCTDQCTTIIFMCVNNMNSKFIILSSSLLCSLNESQPQPQWVIRPLSYRHGNKWYGTKTLLILFVKSHILFVSHDDNTSSTANLTCGVPGANFIFFVYAPPSTPGRTVWRCVSHCYSDDTQI